MHWWWKSATLALLNQLKTATAIHNCIPSATLISKKHKACLKGHGVLIFRVTTTSILWNALTCTERRLQVLFLINLHLRIQKCDKTSKHGDISLVKYNKPESNWSSNSKRKKQTPRTTKKTTKKQLKWVFPFLLPVLEIIISKISYFSNFHQTW